MNQRKMNQRSFDLKHCVSAMLYHQASSRIERYMSRGDFSHVPEFAGRMEEILLYIAQMLEEA